MRRWGLGTSDKFSVLGRAVMHAVRFGSRLNLSMHWAVAGSVIVYICYHYYDVYTDIRAIDSRRYIHNMLYIKLLIRR